MIERIPNYTELRRHKTGYDIRYVIDTEHPLHNDPLVNPREPEFGFHDAISYYSKPNDMTDEQLPGVPDAPLVRLDIAKRLVRAERLLRTDPEVRDALGTPARLRIADGLRPNAVQEFAYNVAWPAVFRKVNPDITDEEIALELTKYIAKPSGGKTPTPHLTGGAVDVSLVNLETDKGFDRGHVRGAVNGTAFPDFHEGYHKLPGESDIEELEAKLPEEKRVPVAAENSEIVLGRQVLHWAMSKAGLYVNPNEIWHYGKGDPLSEYVSGSHSPYYGIAELPEWYTEEMSRLTNPTNK